MVSYTLSILPSTPSYKYETYTSKAQYCANKLFTLGRIENKGDFFPLNILIVQRKQEK